MSSFYDFSALAGSDQYAFFFGGNEPLITVQTDAATDDTLLVFKDSYANCFLPFLADSYKKITVVDPRYYSDTLDALFLQDMTVWRATSRYDGKPVIPEGFVAIATQGSRSVAAYALPMVFDKVYGVTANNMAILGNGNVIYILNLS